MDLESKSVNSHSLEGLEHLIQAGIDKGLEEIKSFQEKGNHQKTGPTRLFFIQVIVEV